MLGFIAEVPLFSLLWFVVGVGAGWALGTMPAIAPVRRPVRQPQREPQSRPSGGGRPPQGAGGRPSGGNGRGGNGGAAPASGGGTGRGVELYVGNLPYETGEKEMRQAFERFGRVLSVRMIENRRNGKPKGFGFVELDSDAAADAAIKAMNGSEYQGRVLVVNEAKSRARRN